jgi:ABC-type antimicrobial peptide transport system permease subunit
MRVIDLDDRLLQMTTPVRVAVGVTASIGLLALLIAAVGVHGVVSYTVATRARDIGIYQALGARPVQVLNLVLGWTLRGVALGAAISLVLLGLVGLAFGGPLRPIFNGVSPLDVPAFFAGLATLTIVIGIAAFLPAGRAIALTPLAALRQDWQ